MSLIYNATFDKTTRKLSFEDRAGNEIYSFTVPERTPAVDDITKPLTFKATQDGSSLRLEKQASPDGSFQTSRDGGNTWTDYTIGSRITLNTGDEVSFRAKADRSKYQYVSDYYYFMMAGKIEAWHNVMSLYHTNDFATCDTAVGSLFSYLFKDCKSLTKAPALPATTLSQACYYHMFEGCQSLAKAPELPATTLTLAHSCYGSMFRGCQSLTKAPELPATKITAYCYQSMFYDCQSLTKAPELPATTLANNCYQNMFSGCQSLKEVRIAATKTATTALDEWLKGVSSTGDFYCDPNATIFPTDSASGIPTGWTRIPKPAPTPAVDDITKPLTFKATQDGSSVKLTKFGSPSGSFQTSRDGGNTWTDYTIDDVIALNTGDEVSFRAKENRTSAQDYSNYFYFMMKGKIEAWHNVMSLYRTNDFATYNTVTSCSFNRLFSGCSSLTKAPALPATTLAPDCYLYMFINCSSLTKAPELPATTLADSCYYMMFSGCQSLTKAPELPATTLADSCYYTMFDGCRSLTKAPELPATTLADSCYESMFVNCQSLTKAPELPATTLAALCYRYMFYGCQSLKEVRVSATKTATDALLSWLSGVSATGDFYCDPNATIFPTDSASGIPANWTRRNIADYPATP